MAEEASFEVKEMHWKLCTGISPKQIDAVQKFFKMTYYGKHQVERTGLFHGKFSVMEKLQKQQPRLGTC